MFKKNIFLTILAIFIVIPNNILGMSFFKSKETEKKLTVQKFNELYSEAISTEHFGAKYLNSLKKTLNAIKANVDQVAIKESLISEINRQIKEAFKTNTDIRNDVLIDWCEKNKLLMWDNELEIDGIINNVYQLKVNFQWAENTCGPRALFNCYTLERFFSKDNTDLDLNIQILDEWLKKSVKIFLKDVRKIIKRSPKNLQSTELEKIIAEYKKDDNSLKIKNITIIDGYETINSSMLVGTMSNGFIQGNNLIRCEDKEFFDGKATPREIGYGQGFVITKGENERNNTGFKTKGHWFSLFGVKTADKQYSWFIMDSLNNTYEKNENKLKIIAYINKLLGNEKFNKYDELLEEKNLPKIIKELT